MTHHPIRTEADGTRVYSNYYRYKPRAPEERRNRVLKPEDPRAVRWHGVWLLPLETLPEAARTMPATRPDADAYDHMGTNLLCTCEVCSRPAAERWRRKWRRDNGLRNRA